MNGRNSIVPRSATSNGVAFRSDDGHERHRQQADLGAELADRSRRSTASEEVGLRQRRWRRALGTPVTRVAAVVAGRGVSLRRTRVCHRVVGAVGVGRRRDSDRLPRARRGRSPELLRGPPARGRRPAGRGVARSPGVHLLDRTSDACHNRSVLTFAGPARPVRDALERRSPSRSTRSTWTSTAGEHPRIGAVDVIPFVPLGDTTMDEAIALARAFGARDRGAVRAAGLPVRAGRDAPRPREARRCPTRPVRGAQAEIGERGREPDFGPARMHPSAGAVAVGARPFLIAWNINLDSRDLELAKRIARRVRESGGGLPRVQAMASGSRSSAAPRSR